MKNKLLTALVLLLVAAVGVQGWFLYRLNQRLEPGSGNTTTDVIPGPTLNSQNNQGPQTTDPFAQMRQLQSRIDRLFSNAFSSPGNSTPFSDPFGNAFAGRTNSPRLDLEDKGDHYRLQINLPGTDKSEIHVGIKDKRVLTINATTQGKQDNHSGDVLQHERFVGTYQRSLTLPHAVDPGTMHSQYKDGVLTLTVRKATA